MLALKPMPRGRGNGLVESRRNLPLRQQLEARDELIARDKAAVGCRGPQPLPVLVLEALDVEHCESQARRRGGHKTAPMVFFRCLYRRNPQIRALLHFRPRTRSSSTERPAIWRGGSVGLRNNTLTCVIAAYSG